LPAAKRHHTGGHQTAEIGFVRTTFDARDTVGCIVRSHDRGHARIRTEGHDQIAIPHQHAKRGETDIRGFGKAEIETQHDKPVLQPGISDFRIWSDKAAMIERELGIGVVLQETRQKLIGQCSLFGRREHAVAIGIEASQQSATCGSVEHELLRQAGESGALNSKGETDRDGDIGMRKDG
jgi:hypothetical protein